jgi:triosephosphate isomerase
MLKNLCLRQLFSFSRNKRFIGGNWKSNNTLEQSKKIIKETINQLKFNHDSVGKYLTYLDVIVAPVCLHISTVKDALLYPDVKVAAQNCSSYNFGAYTG